MDRMKHVELIPAGDTRYKTAEEVHEAWKWNYDFVINERNHPNNGRTTNNITHPEDTIYVVRYDSGRRTTLIHPPVKPSPYPYRPEQ